MKDIEFLGIVDFGYQNNDQPFLGVLKSYDEMFETTVITAGCITGNITDIHDECYYYETCDTIEEFERLHETKIERITYSEACRRIYEDFKSKHPSEYDNITMKFGEIELEFPTIFKQLKAAI